MSDDRIMDLFGCGLVWSFVVWALSYTQGWFAGFKYGAAQSVADAPDSAWRKALIDAEAERAKEAIK